MGIMNKCQSGEMADTEDLKSSDLKDHEGSSPSSGTKKYWDVGLGLSHTTFRFSNRFRRLQARGLCQVKWQGKEHTHTCRKYKSHTTYHICNCGCTKRLD